MALQTTGLLASLSSELAGVVETVGPSVVRVDDGTRLTATGIVWSADGLIVSTSHGVERDEDLFIELSDGSRHAATVVGRDPDTDIALLKVNAQDLPAIARAGSGDIKVGHLALALGRPGTSGLQATIGILSSRMESQSGGVEEFVLHTDAILYPGFSGGPLVNVMGEMVGLNNLLFGRGKGVALGTPIVANVVEALQAHGRIRRGYLGVRTQHVQISTRLRQELTLTQERGLLIVQAEPDSPAEKGGLLMGDVLLSIGTHLTQDVDELRSQLRAHKAGDSIPVRILRGGQIQDVTVTLGAEA